jgi:hypothetical protein
MDAQRADIARRYLRGQKQWEIARDLGVTQQAVSQQLRKLHQQWRERAAGDLAAKRAEELAKIDQLEAAYWDAWERSQRDRLVRGTQKEVLPPPAGGGIPKERLKAFTRKEPRDGDPAFLDGIAWCIEQRCKILGLVITKVAPVTPAGEASVPILQIIFEGEGACPADPAAEASVN